MARRHPFDIADARLLAVLGKYVPPIIARSIVERARREAASGPEVSWTDPNGLLDRISVGVRLFAAPEQVPAILREITNLAEEDMEAPSSQSFDDSPPASTLKPNATRLRSDEVPTRRETTVMPPSSGAGAAAPSSRRDFPPQPPSSAPSSYRDGVPPSRRDRDTDVAAFTWRTHDTPPPSRGVFPTGIARTTNVPTTPRSPGTRAASPAPFPAIPPPPPFNLRVPAPTPAAGLPLTLPEFREVTIALITEHDIPRARQVAREICEALGTRALTQQRLLTIVSELGRNQVLYAGGGKITLRPPSGGSRRVVVIAVDSGPGIANLSEIMAGRYKSRSGLGLGIVGTKRLADSFHIETGRHGTAISVEVIV